MRNQAMCIAIAIVLLCPFASAQWVQTSLPDSLWVNCLAVSGTNLFAGTSGDVYLSTDNGTSWTAANGGLPKTLPVIDLAIQSTSVFAASGGVFRSTNNGPSWTAVNNGLTDLAVWSLAH